jgi:hypothetical protein
MTTHIPDGSLDLTLRDIHAPPDIPWWPPAPGWWVLSAAGLVLAVVLYLRWRRDAPRRQALQILLQIEMQRHARPSDASWMSQLSLLMRRLVKTVHPASPASVGSGERWIEFLLDTGFDVSLMQRARPWLMQGPYEPTVSLSDSQAHALLCGVRRWISRQRPAVRRGC